MTVSIPDQDTRQDFLLSRESLNVLPDLLGHDRRCKCVPQRFNSHNSRARSIIELGFGMMKSRFRVIFLQALEVHHTFVPQAVHPLYLFGLSSPLPLWSLISSLISSISSSFPFSLSSLRLPFLAFFLTPPLSGHPLLHLAV
ncbi:hypothetical protein F7725_012009, partial [Dissostichus mawsoni]